MKHLSKALFAAALFTATSAVHAQDSYFGTTFDGVVAPPYTDGTVYTTDSTPGQGQINGQGGFVSTAGNEATVSNIGGAFNNVGALAANGTPGESITRGFGLTNPDGYVFTTDFSIYAPGNLDNANNRYSFNFQGATGTNLFGVSFIPSATPGNSSTIALTTYNPVTGAPTDTVDASNPGVGIGQYYRLSLTVTGTGVVSATFSGLDTSGATPVANGTALAIAPTTVAGSNLIQGLSIDETAATNGGTDLLLFDNISVAVPEPSTYATMALGLLGMVGLMRFRRLKA